MSNEITTGGEKKVFFSVKEGSNYKVLMTYDREEVIEFDQYKKLVNVINNVEVQFLTINQRIVNKSTIIDISPTTDLTVIQKKAAEEKAMKYKKAKDREDELQRIKNNFDVEFFNNKYGVGKWKRYAFGINRGDDLILTEKDLKDCIEAFKAQYPQEYREIEKISENR